MDIFIKLAGMHSDHCAKEKKDFRLMGKEKELATFQSLGEKEMKENEDLQPHYSRAWAQMIKAAGGKRKWDKLSTLEQAEHEAKMLENLVIELGKESFDKLSDDEKRTLKLFIWAGCGCHKDLNTVRGGNASMMAWWKENNIPGPILLANRDNAAVINEESAGDEITPAMERALQKTTRGGIKAAQLAGEILNNKNDKKGHHNAFRWWWSTNFDEEFTFPDTSNNRFQSHCEAAAVLIQYLDRFITFLEYAKNQKQVMRFSHMEQNLRKALDCPATKTELVVLAVYGQVISHPYMRQTCGPAAKKVNMLDLTVLHKNVYGHMQRIIRDPTLVIGPSVTHETGCHGWSALGLSKCFCCCSTGGSRPPPYFASSWCIFQRSSSNMEAIHI
jgi:hypothetical protein